MFDSLSFSLNESYDIYIYIVDFFKNAIHVIGQKLIAFLPLGKLASHRKLPSLVLAELAP